MIQGERDQKISVDEEIQKADGSLKTQTEEDKMMKTVIDDDEAQAEGKVLNEATDRGISFNADIMFNNMTKNFQNAQKLYGETIIRELTDHSPGYVERNSNIPEFKRELKDRIKRKLTEMRKKGLIDFHGQITELGSKLSSVTICIHELDKINTKNFIGENVIERKSHYGQKDLNEDEHLKRFNFKDLALKRTIKAAVRRGHSKISEDDFRVFHRKAKGSINIIYGMDVSGSMRGPKINVAKKSGIALAYKAIQSRDKVGLIAFNSEIVKELRPMSDFQQFVDSLVDLKSGKETNMVHAIERAIEMFPDNDATKHLLLLTDAVPTVGEIDQTMQAVMKAKAAGITISVVGIKLTEGLELAQSIVEATNGKLYVIRNLDNMDSVILEDYYAF